MANFIPKITYTELYTGYNKIIVFDSPPEKEWNEEIKGVFKETKSSSGNFQRQFNFNETTYDLNFRFQTSLTMSKVDDFMLQHAMRGGAFNYYISEDEAEYETFRLESGSYKKERPIFENGGPEFEYHFKFSIIRTLDFELELPEGDLGMGAIAETQFTINNNQTSPEDIDGLFFDKNIVRSAIVTYQIYRKTTGIDAVELAEAGTIKCIYLDTAGIWNITKESNGDAEVEITMNNAGQLRYTSSDITGTPSISAMRFRASTIGKEV
jgi:hypothetical protein